MGEIATEKFDNLKQVPPVYHTLMEEAGKSSLFLTHYWFDNFIENIIGENEVAQLYGVKNGDSVPLAGLLVKKPVLRIGLLGSRKVKSLTNYYTSLFGPFIDLKEYAVGEILELMVEHIKKDSNSWDVLELRPLDHSSPLFQELVQTFQKSGFLVQPFFDFGNWYLDLDGRNYSEYFQSLPSQLRKKIPYKKRKLEKRGKVDIKIITDIDDVDIAIDDFEAIYKASWKKPEPYPHFIRSLAKMASRQGWLRLGVLYFDDKPVASQLWFVHNKIASIFKLSYVQDYAVLSVGTILTAHLMEHVIEKDDVVQVDYLTGDDSYKKDWMNKRRERWGIMVFNTHSLPGLVEAVRNFGGHKVKLIWKACQEKIVSFFTAPN